jgi:hypothetical protein
LIVIIIITFLIVIILFVIIISPVTRASCLRCDSCRCTCPR